MDVRNLEKLFLRNLRRKIRKDDCKRCIKLSKISKKLMPILLVSSFSIFITGASGTRVFATQDQYSCMYNYVGDAMLSRTQYSIDYAREKLNLLPNDLAWCKPEFSKQLDILEQGLLDEAIDSYYKVLQTSDIEDINTARRNLEELHNSPDVSISSWAVAVNTQLDYTISTIPDRQLYNNAVHQISNTVYPLPNTINSAKNGKLKVAFWGDSITEGLNVDFKDAYPQLFIKKVKSLLPNVDVQYSNFALASRTLANAVNPDYLANNPEQPLIPNVGVPDFWRSWSVQGKSWQQHVVDYKPDLLIISFGMNDSGDTGTPQLIVMA